MRLAASLIAIASCAVATSAQAAYMASRPCKGLDDVKGLWLNVDIKEDPKGAVTEAFKANPYEYMMFNGTGKFAYLARATPADLSDDEKIAAFAQEVVTQSEKSGKYTDVEKNGIITLSHDGVPWARFKCVIAQLDAIEDGVKYGDMVWYTLDGITPDLRRIERKVSRPAAP